MRICDAICYLHYRSDNGFPTEGECCVPDRRHWGASGKAQFRQRTGADRMQKQTERAVHTQTRSSSASSAAHAACQL